MNTKKKVKKGAIEVLKKYLKAWKKGNLKEMLKHSTKTYRAYHKEDHFDEFIGSKKLQNFKIGKPIKLGDAMEEVPVEITYTQKEENFTKQINPRIVCELEAYSPSVNGSWGVNPISTFKEEEIKPKEEVKK